MKLSTLFLMMVLVGTLGVIGCDSDAKQSCKDACDGVEQEIEACQRACDAIR